MLIMGGDGRARAAGEFLLLMLELWSGGRGDGGGSLIHTVLDAQSQQ